MLHAKKLHPEATLPTVAHAGEDLGYDIYAVEDAVLLNNTPTQIKTGIAVQAFTKGNWSLGGELSPSGQEPLGLLIQDRSSMGRRGIRVLGGVVDHGYTGEVMVQLVLLNGNNPVYHISKGDKIAQMVPVPILTGVVVEVGELSSSGRGDKGFGSTGK